MSGSFSERRGLTTPLTELQTDWMSDALRNSLWNVLDEVIWSQNNFMSAMQRRDAGIYRFSRHLWASYFKMPVDLRPVGPDGIYTKIRDYFFFDANWNEVYDFLEWVQRWAAQPHRDQMLEDSINSVLERELAGYRSIDGLFVDVTDPIEVKALHSTLQDQDFPAVRSHLQRALQLLADREKPDYRNSIKESISAVESMAKVVTGQEGATLGKALVMLERDGALHPVLKQSFSKLYGYTSDEGGIRHAMLEEPNLTAADAKFFLLSCTSFINYLKAKL